MVIDPIANYISNLRNASVSGKEMVVFPYSKLKNAITDTLEREGFVKNLTKKGKKGVKTVEVKIVYESDKSKIHGVERISKPSKRIYGGAAALTPVKSGQGVLIVSTSNGVLTDKDARKQGIGGEVLFKIW